MSQPPETLAKPVWRTPTTLAILGYDQYGHEVAEQISVPLPLYFWLGRDAYPEPKMISGMIAVRRGSIPWVWPEWKFPS